MLLVHVRQRLRVRQHPVEMVDAGHTDRGVERDRESRNRPEMLDLLRRLKVDGAHTVDDRPIRALLVQHGSVPPLSSLTFGGVVRRKAAWTLLVAPHLGGGILANSVVRPSAIVGCVRMASRKPVYGRPASIAVCTAAMTSPASGPSIVKPRMRSPCESTSAFMKPPLSEIVHVRSTARIGSFATRTPMPRRRASASLRPTRASGGSLNMHHGTSRSRAERVPPARLPRLSRMSRQDTCVHCGHPPLSPSAP